MAIWNGDLRGGGAMEAAASALNAASPLTEADLSRLRGFWTGLQRLDPGGEIKGERRCGSRALIVDGWACEMRALHDGRRQIFGFLLPGDVIDFGARDRRSLILALTRVEHLDLTGPLKDELGAGRTTLFQAVDAMAALQGQRIFDHIVRLGQLSAAERAIHMLLELHERLSAAGLTRGESFRLPVTQETLADALGLSLVHLNRVLQQLRREGLIELRLGSITFLKPQKLRQLGAYEPRSDPGYAAAS